MEESEGVTAELNLIGFTGVLFFVLLQEAGLDKRCLLIDQSGITL